MDLRLTCLEFKLGFSNHLFVLTLCAGFWIMKTSAHIIFFCILKSGLLVLLLAESLTHFLFSLHPSELTLLELSKNIFCTYMTIWWPFLILIEVMKRQNPISTSWMANRQHKHLISESRKNHVKTNEWISDSRPEIRWVTLTWLEIKKFPDHKQTGI